MSEKRPNKKKLSFEKIKKVGNDKIFELISNSRCRFLRYLSSRHFKYGTERSINGDLPQDNQRLLGRSSNRTWRTTYSNAAMSEID
ncbi:hypothetical protein BpHYR1_036672 [Brachionus plicatilis]|uniref:Uncharacterized protein n=1 Tax=Brachionus plicatilis TaxID=10195 RepID=A0A3M7P484_BRAPC|nr:hypothetical protein BpHYR1_036672 [Brachionus plicatilis]